MKQKLIEVATFILFLVPLLIILASPTFSSQALDMNGTKANAQPAWGYTRQTFYAVGGMYDGWILESGTGTGIGGVMNSSTPTMPIGDNAQNRRYRGIISFDTAKVPNGAYLDSVTLYLHGNGYIGKSPFDPDFWNPRTTLDIYLKKGYFSGDKYLQLSDFRTPATVAKPISQYFCYAKARCTIHLDRYDDYSYINKVGFTQFRLGFSGPSDGNSSANNYQVFTGDAGALTNRPTLVIAYYP